LLLAGAQAADYLCLQPLVDELAPVRLELLLGRANAALRARENAVRETFSRPPDPARGDDPHAELLEVFSPAHHGSFVHEVQGVARGDERLELLLESLRLPGREHGAASVVPSLQTFCNVSWRKFSGGALDALPTWDGVLVAGGAVLAALLPLPRTRDAQTGAMRPANAADTDAWYALGSGYRPYRTTIAPSVTYANGRSGSGFESSDIDVFLYGLTPAAALKRIRQIRHAVRPHVLPVRVLLRMCDAQLTRMWPHVRPLGSWATQ
jgi:hypothetical protein